MHPKLRHRTDMGRPKVVQQQEGVRLLLGELVQAVRDEDFSRAERVGLAGLHLLLDCGRHLWALCFGTSGSSGAAALRAASRGRTRDLGSNTSCLEPFPANALREELASTH